MSAVFRPLPPTVLLIIVLIIGCAKISAPPGGPADETGPEIVSTTPANGAVSIAPVNEIIIGLSEKIDRNSLEGTIFISPRFEGDLEYDLDGQNLIVELPDSMKDNTTYIVNVGSQLEDLRRNEMNESYTFAFSTGKEISQGKIIGSVMKNGRPKAGASVALYEFAQPDSSTIFDSLFPPYLTQTGEDGNYTLEYLPEGEYFILAFEDTRYKHQFNYPREAFGIPDRKVIVSPDRPPVSINFSLQKKDTAAIEILSVAATENRLVKIRFSRNISIGSLLDNLENIMLISSTGDTLRAAGVLEPEDSELAAYNIYFGPPIAGQNRVVFEHGIYDDREDSLKTSPQFQIESIADSAAPRVVRCSHNNRTLFPSDSIITITFSEPMKNISLKNAVRLIDSDSVDNMFSVGWPDPFRMQLAIDQLRWGEEYILMIVGDSAVDLSGNNLVDSLYQCQFSVYPEDSIGQVSGEILFAGEQKPDGDPYLIFLNNIGQEILRSEIMGNTFSFQLPPGKYLIEGFLDENDNGKKDLGTLFPFRYAETSVAYPDTVRVRARFETAGIEFLFK